MSFLLANNIITKNQHGFLSKHSTATNILECLHDWNLSLNNNRRQDIAYIDFARAFDSVVHSKLLHKLHNYGVRGKLYNWISEFLSGRSQCTVVENEFSSVKNVNSGVIQGSCLGPLLFLLFINDIDGIGVNDSICKLYADDLKLYTNYTDSDSVDSLQSTLNNLYAWSVKWQLGINYSKCHILHLGSKNSNSNYFINGFKIDSGTVVTDLGIQVDSNLRFNCHINNICSRAHSRICMLFRGFVSRDPELLIKAYKIYVRPLLEYCTVVWSPWQIGLIHAVENVQRYFTRRLLWPKVLSYRERLALFNLELLELRRIKFDMYYCFKILNNLTCLDSNLYFSNDNRNILKIRNYDDKLLRVSQFVNNRTDNLFFNRCVHIWNSLTYECRSITCFIDFKRYLDNHDFSKFLKGHV